MPHGCLGTQFTADLLKNLFSEAALCFVCKDPSTLVTRPQLVTEHGRRNDVNARKRVAHPGNSLWKGTPPATAGRVASASRSITASAIAASSGVCEMKYSRA